MKKIVVFHHCGNIGGAGVSLINTVSMLSDAYDIVVYTERGEITNLMSASGIKFKILKNPLGAISSYSGSPRLLTRTYFRKLKQIIKSKKEIIDILLEEKPDLIFVNSITTAYITKIAAGLKIDSVAFVRETRRQDLGTLFNEHILSVYPKAVLFITEYDQKMYKISNPRKSVIYNSLIKENYNFNISRNEACNILKIREDCFNVLYLGGDSQIKGWKMIKSAIMSSIEDSQFIIAGECNDDTRPQGGNVRYIGMQKNISVCMSCADVLVFPVESPHQGRPIFEAGAFKLPVIVPRFNVFSEAVQESINGLFYNPGDVNDFCRAILTMKNDNNLRMQLGIKNYEYTNAKHLYENNKIKMNKIFKDVMRNK